MMRFNQYCKDILHILADKSVTYEEIRKNLGNIPISTLTGRLRRLRIAGLVARRVINNNNKHKQHIYYRTGQWDNEAFSPLQYRIIKTLQDHGPLSREDLKSLLQTPRTTIFNNLDGLLDAQIVGRCKLIPKKGRGRLKIGFYILTPMDAL